MLLIGYLGKDSHTNEVGGKTVINFTVAHTEKWRGADGNTNEKTIWVDCSYWVDRDSLSQYLKKGTQVYAEGTPEVRTYVANDGSTKATQNLRVFNVQLLGGGNNRESNSGGSYQANSAPRAAPSTPPPSTTTDEPYNDDLPF